jgi:hypothetical protein
MPRNVRSIKVQDADASIRRATVTGPLARLPGVLSGYENCYNPRVERLRREYRIGGNRFTARNSLTLCRVATALPTPTGMISVRPIS